ncbi:MAG: glutamine-synthetase adenylyltransferase [Rhodobacterales bacterium]|nr:MAG: glutamine-synthetase adenylyltransferase [Rhodobacterales bacterium]
MTTASRLTRSPDPFDAARGAEVAARFGDLAPELRGVIAGAAGCSPYLAGLAEKETDWLIAALDDPEAALSAVLAELARLDGKTAASGLRQAKRRVALLAGLMDLGGVWALEDVTGALTRLADAATQTAIRVSVGALIGRGKLPGMTEEDTETGAGMVALAMGKGGAFELNYSSDIDLICLFDETRYSTDDYLEARAGLIKATRQMAALIGDVTGEGYVFRTDLRLRPDPSVTPVCVPMAGAESYYESMGRTWERAAYIKARACAGDIAAGERFLKTLTPFVWRKHLDFAAIEDAHTMRLRIREHKGLGGAITLPGHDMKLGRGGIREIEFFTQTRQLIAGGRDESLRVRGTVDGLARLADAGWVASDLAATLTDHYRFHREVEHRLQMVQDAQTQKLPGSDEGFDRLAAFMGRDRAGLEAELHARLEEVHAKTEDFFAPDAAPDPAPHKFDEGVLDGWLSYPALRSNRAVEIFNRLRPKILARLDGASDPEGALKAFDAFLAGLPAGVQVFSLFDANPPLLDLMADICTTSPELARYLGAHSAVLDAVIGGDFFAPWPGEARLHDDLLGLLGKAPDYEAKLDTARRWQKEWRFRTGVHLMQGAVSGDEAGRHHAELAGAVIRALWPVVVEEFARKHGPLPGKGAIVLGMGSIGAGRIHSESDLDLILLYDADDAEMSEGPRSLAVRPYYARLTQALITALSARMAQGQLYEVDMRLRPSGRGGPVATPWAGFQTYQENGAWTWEHLALTRARVVAGADDLAQDFNAFREGLLRRKGQEDKVRADLAEMRQKIRDAKGPAGPWSAKLGPGRLQDVELAAQSLALRAGAPARAASGQIAAGAEAAKIDADGAARLEAAAALFWDLQITGKLLVGEAPLDPQALGAGAQALLCRVLGADDMAAAERKISATAEAADAAITALLSEA